MRRGGPGPAAGARAEPGSGAPAGEDLVPLGVAVAVTLRWGFRIGAALLAIGLVLAIVRREPLDTEVDPLGEVIPAVLAGRAGSVVEVAILWLMGTPVLAVIVVLIGFLRLRDRRYALLSLLVLLVLGVSIGLALARG